MNDIRRPKDILDQNNWYWIVIYKYEDEEEISRIGLRMERAADQALIWTIGHPTKRLLKSMIECFQTAPWGCSRFLRPDLYSHFKKIKGIYDRTTYFDPRSNWTRVDINFFSDKNIKIYVNGQDLTQQYLHLLNLRIY